MNIFLINIALAMIWVTLTGVFNPVNLIFGFGLGYLILYLMRGLLGSTTYFGKVKQAIEFVVFFLKELLVANLRVAKRVLSPKHRMSPRVIAVPLESCSEAEVTILANLISLTPGSLSLDVSMDRCILYVHVINAPDPDLVIREIKQGLERRILTLFRSHD